MSNFEIFLIVGACVVPLVALLFVLPKLKKKDKNKIEEQIKTLEDLKKEEKKPEPFIEVPVKKVNSSEISSKDIESYIDYKKKNITKPHSVQMPSNIKDTTLPYMPRRRQGEKKSQSVAEEIKNLSPELKVLIISGVLEPKNFDKI